MALPQSKSHSDIHCVTTWSRYDNDWEGARIADMLSLVQVKPEAKHVMFHAYGGYTTNVPLDELLYNDALLAHPTTAPRCPSSTVAAGCAPVLLEEREVGARY
ncbi:MAG: molybdopterin-dependent oxidoreductase [Dehalococcoidia bacterium]